MFFRGIITKCADAAKGLKIFSAEGRVDEELEDRELFQQRGFSSVPKEGDQVLILERGGLKIAICSETDDRPSLEPGEAAIYSSKDNFIRLNKAGEIEIVSKGKKIIFDGDLEIGGKLTTSGEIDSGGEVTANATTIPIALSTHKHGTAVGATTPPTP